MLFKYQLLLGIHLGLVLSLPSCKFSGVHGTTFFCKAGTSDYSLARGLVSDNNRTTVVVLKSCRIIDVDFESFDGLPNARAIDLSLNKIQTLKLGVLDESQHVKRLNLSYNLLSAFPLGLFDQMANLEILDIRGNKFKVFELGIFDMLKKLVHLDISSNELKSDLISAYLLDQTKKIKFLDYSRNDMSKAPNNMLNSLQVLDVLNLDSCSLRAVPQFALDSNLGSLRHLMLSSNQIPSISDAYTFKNLIGLQILDLTGNKIVTLHQNVFNPLRKLTMLILRYNRIQSLPANIFHDLPELGNLDLSHNALNTIHENAFRGLPRLRRLNLSINRLTYLPVNFLEGLVSSGTNLVKFYFNQNPWQCACLKEVLQEAKKYALMYNDNKYMGKEPVCAEPEAGRFLCRRTLAESDQIAQLFDTRFQEWAKA